VSSALNLIVGAPPDLCCLRPLPYRGSTSLRTHTFATNRTPSLGAAPPLAGERVRNSGMRFQSDAFTITITDVTAQLSAMNSKVVVTRRIVASRAVAAAAASAAAGLDTYGAQYQDV